MKRDAWIWGTVNEPQMPHPLPGLEQAKRALLIVLRSSQACALVSAPMWKPEGAEGPEGWVSLIALFLGRGLVSVFRVKSGSKAIRLWVLKIGDSLLPPAVHLL